MNGSEVLQQYRDYLVLKNYRPQTLKSYFKIIVRFLKFCNNHTDSNLSAQQYAKAYLVHRFDTGKSWSSVNMDYSAILILCRHVLKIEWPYNFSFSDSDYNDYKASLSGIFERLNLERKKKIQDFEFLMDGISNEWKEIRKQMSNV